MLNQLSSLANKLPERPGMYQNLNFATNLQNNFHHLFKHCNYTCLHRPYLCCFSLLHFLIFVQVAMTKATILDEKQINTENSLRDWPFIIYNCYCKELDTTSCHFHLCGFCGHSKTACRKYQINLRHTAVFKRET